MDKKELKRILASSLVAGTLVLSPTLSADSTPEGWKVAAAGKKAEEKAEHKCGEGKCGDKTKKSAEHKCGEGKCGDKKGKKKAKGGSEHKCGEGQCG